MPTITLDYHVAQGTYGITANTNFKFGTQGLGTCVGVIMTLNDGTNFCGHLDSSYEPTSAQKAEYMAAVTALLNASIPAGVAPTAVYYDTPGGTRAAQYAVEAIVAWFPGAVNAGGNSCIYIDGTGVHTTEATIVDGLHAVYNGAFSV